MQLEDLINHLNIAPYHLDDIFLYTGLISITLLIIALITEKKHKKLSNFALKLTLISSIVPLTIAMYTTINHDYENYTISRDNTYLYVHSHSDYLKSAKLKIIKNDEYFIYAKRWGNTYRIPIIPLKEKN